MGDVVVSVRPAALVVVAPAVAVALRLVAAMVLVVRAVAVAAGVVVAVVRAVALAVVAAGVALRLVVAPACSVLCVCARAVRIFRSCGAYLFCGWRRGGGGVVVGMQPGRI